MTRRREGCGYTSPGCQRFYQACLFPNIIITFVDRRSFLQHCSPSVSQGLEPNQPCWEALATAGWFEIVWVAQTLLSSSYSIENFHLGFPASGTAMRTTLIACKS